MEFYVGSSGKGRDMENGPDKVVYQGREAGSGPFLQGRVRQQKISFRYAINDNLFNTEQHVSVLFSR